MENSVENSELGSFKASTSAMWLEEVRRLKKEADLAYDLMLDERRMLDGLKGIDYAKVPTGSSQDPMLGSIERLEASMGRYSEKMAEYIEERDKAAASIRLIAMPGRAVLAYYYLAGKTWPWIERRLSYSHGGVMKIRRQALTELFDVMPPDRGVNIPRAI